MTNRLADIDINETGEDNRLAGIDINDAAFSGIETEPYGSRTAPTLTDPQEAYTRAKETQDIAVELQLPKCKGFYYVIYNQKL